MVNRGGICCYVPVSDRDNSVINSYSKWEMAFRIFTNIYASKFPTRATELTQYSHVIHTAAMTYVWPNVYKYDKDFRMHLSLHPKRSWGIILTQAWNMRLREKLSSNGGSGHNSNTGGRNGGYNGGTPGSADKRRRDVCYRFNRGKCTYGLNCKFEHKCALCLKFGHGSHNCRRAVFAERDGETGENRYRYEGYGGRNGGGDRYHYRGNDDKKKQNKSKDNHSK